MTSVSNRGTECSVCYSTLQVSNSMSFHKQWSAMKTIKCYLFILLACIGICILRFLLLFMRLTHLTVIHQTHTFNSSVTEVHDSLIIH